MFFGYNTNGMAHHELFDAIRLLAELGYRGVAITIDHNALPPYASYGVQRIHRLRSLLEKLGMRSVVETGARFLLDPRQKHEPTLITPDAAGRARRIDFYKYAIDCAAELGSDCVSLWSGAVPFGEGLPTPPAFDAGLPTPPKPATAGLQRAGRPSVGEVARSETGHNETSTGSSSLFTPEQRRGTRSSEHGETLSSAQAMDWLVVGLHKVLDYARQRHVKIGFEPEPGMLIDSMRGWEGLIGRQGLDDLGLTLDIGHLHCQGEGPIAEVIRRWASRLVNVHIEDIKAGVHEHLMFGEGEIDFPPVLKALDSYGYQGGVYVELSRHSHEAPAAARRAMEFLARSGGC